MDKLNPSSTHPENVMQPNRIPVLLAAIVALALAAPMSAQASVIWMPSHSGTRLTNTLGPLTLTAGSMATPIVTAIPPLKTRQVRV
jgi:hypothetical protein